jgi:hypothetical protein
VFLKDDGAAAQIAHTAALCHRALPSNVLVIRGTISELKFNCIGSPIVRTAFEYGREPTLERTPGRWPRASVLLTGRDWRIKTNVCPKKAKLHPPPVIASQRGPRRKWKPITECRARSVLRALLVNLSCDG